MSTVKKVKYFHILFDADGTLLDFVQAEEEALKQTLKKLNLPFNRQIREQYGVLNQHLWEEFEKDKITKEGLKIERFRRLLTFLKIEDDPSEIDRIYTKELSRCNFLIANALPVCQKLSELCQLSIITNGLARIQHERIRSSLLGDLIGEIFVSETIRYQKPHPAYFEAVLNDLAIREPADALVVGDSLTADIAGGVGAGLATCWYNPNRLKNDSFVQPDFEIRDLCELLPIVLS